MPPSQFRGVSWNGKGNKWAVTLHVRGTNTYVGTFAKEEEAARAYDAAASSVLAAPILNFLPDGTRNPDRKKNFGTKHALKGGVNVKTTLAAISEANRARSAATERTYTRRTYKEELRVWKKPQSTSSKYRWVSWHRHVGKWAVNFQVGTLVKHLGFFLDEEAAAKAYDAAARAVLANPVTNFLPDGTPNPDRNKFPARYIFREGVDVEAALAAVIAEHRTVPQRGSSQFKGVRWVSSDKKWTAVIQGGGGVSKSLGRFDDEAEAARAYDAAAKKMLKAPILNFLPDGSLNPDRKKPCKRGGRVLLDGGGGSSDGDDGASTEDEDDGGGYGGSAGGGGRGGRGSDTEAESEYELDDNDSDDSSLYISDDSEEEEDEEEDEYRKRPRKARAAAASSSSSNVEKRHSSFRGVIPEGRRWHVRIFFKNYTTHLGTFDTEEEAARAYDAEARRIWENAICNFHRNGSLNPNRNSREGARTMVPRPGVEPLNGEKRKEREQEKKASTFRGVTHDRIKWRAQIKFKNKLYGLGRFATEEEAARAHDAAAMQLFENAQLNFLPDGTTPNPERQAYRPYGSLIVRPGAYPPRPGSAMAAHRLLALADEGKREAQQLEQELAEEEEAAAGEAEEEQLPPLPPPPPPPPLVIEGPVVEV